jgi:hypothetical protein
MEEGLPQQLISAAQDLEKAEMKGELGVDLAARSREVGALITSVG